MNTNFSKPKTQVNSLKKYIIAVVAGNGLECYDFALFGYFAPIFSQQFFPSASVYTSLISTFAVFAVGFLGRPLGAYIFGQFGDSHGRKKAMIVSMMLMAISTCLIGLLPNYAHIGLWAPLLLTLLRISQGISIGGEYTSGLSFIIKHSTQEHRGFSGSFNNVGTAFGLALGVIIGVLTTSLLSKEQVDAWGWRIPFLFGSCIAFLGYYMRRHVEETPQFLQLKRTHAIESHPFKKVFMSHWKTILIMSLLASPLTVWTYLIFVYLPTYLTQLMHWDLSLALGISLFPILGAIIFLPLGGYLSDRYGKQRLFTIGLTALTFVSLLIFLIDKMNSISYLIYVELIASFFLSLAVPAANVIITEAYPTPVRNTGVALSYNIGLAIFGGFTPLILIWLSSALGTDIGPIIWVIITISLGLGSLHLYNTLPSLSIRGLCNESFK